MVIRILELLLFIAGLGFAALGGAGMYSARSRRAWPSAKGTVRSAEVLDLGTHFAGVVRYVYACRGVSAYRDGDPQTVGKVGKLESAASTSREAAEELMRRYPVGERIDVWYDPTRPTRSTLGPVAPHAPLATWMGVAGVVLALATAIVGLSR